MESSVECMIDDTVLTTCGGGSFASGLILDQIRCEVEVEVARVKPGTVLWIQHPVLGLNCVTDLMLLGRMHFSSLLWS